MATYTVDQAAHKTLTLTTVDTVNIPSNVVRVMNRVGADPLWVTVDGTDPVASADDMHVIPPGSWKDIKVSATHLRQDVDDPNVVLAVVKVLGNGNQYTVEEVW